MYIEVVKALGSQRPSLIKKLKIFKPTRRFILLKSGLKKLWGGPRLHATAIKKVDKLQDTNLEHSYYRRP